ncbi:hypothetical protein [Rhizobium sp. Leaf371]|uniref:hypothetical protein n=1 Tax=Rhizobium sp. Leaf371 TaxID=1736355 RepID=UPI0012E7F853|nr:hypothetical protein [Rhizobium sp. Leaf371]
MAMDSALELGQPILSDTSTSPPTKTAEEERRLNVRLSPSAGRALDAIAEYLEVSQVEAIRQAIGTEKFFLDLRSKKAKIFVQMPGEDNLKQVIFKS